MSINATLLGQMITFGIFVLFTMKFVWPLLNKALIDRKNKIADGLAAAKKGHKILENANIDAKHHLIEARKQAKSITDNANLKATKILEEIKVLAKKEKDEIVLSGDKQVRQCYNQMKYDLENNVSELVLLIVKKVLSREINSSDHRALINDLSKNIKDIKI